MSTSDLQHRLLEVIKSTTLEHRRFKQLEELTNIPADRWKNLWLGRQRPTSEMIEAICTTWPEYAFWVVTGISDDTYGHSAPAGQGYPTTPKEMQYTSKFFRTAISCREEARNVLKQWSAPETRVTTGIADAVVKRIADLMSGTGDDEFDDEDLRIVLSLLPEQMTEALERKLEELLISGKIRQAEILLKMEIPVLEPHGLRWTTDHWKRIRWNPTTEAEVLDSLLPAIRSLLQFSTQNSKSAQQHLDTAHLEDELKNIVAEIGKKSDAP